MGVELMEFRLAGEYDPERVWFRHLVGTPEIHIITGDSQHGDKIFVMNEGNVAQLRAWLAEVDRRTWTD
jgi:hypothetical protein